MVGHDVDAGDAEAWSGRTGRVCVRKRSVSSSERVVREREDAQFQIPFVPSMMRWRESMARM